MNCRSIKDKPKRQKYRDLSTPRNKFEMGTIAILFGQLFFALSSPIDWQQLIKIKLFLDIGKRGRRWGQGCVRLHRVLQKSRVSLIGPDSSVNYHGTNFATCVLVIGEIFLLKVTFLKHKGRWHMDCVTTSRCTPRTSAQTDKSQITPQREQ